MANAINILLLLLLLLRSYAEQWQKLGILCFSCRLMENAELNPTQNRRQIIMATIASLCGCMGVWAIWVCAHLHIPGQRKKSDVWINNSIGLHNASHAFCTLNAKCLPGRELRKNKHSPEVPN